MSAIKTCGEEKNLRSSSPMRLKWPGYGRERHEAEEDHHKGCDDRESMYDPCDESQHPQRHNEHDSADQCDYRVDKHINPLI
jgi:hypothetical protein